MGKRLLIAHVLCLPTKEKKCPYDNKLFCFTMWRMKRQEIKRGVCVHIDTFTFFGKNDS